MMIWKGCCRKQSLPHFRWYLGKLAIEGHRKAKKHLSIFCMSRCLNQGLPDYKVGVIGEQNFLTLVVMSWSFEIEMVACASNVSCLCLN
jgi:hypothetical protein